MKKIGIEIHGLRLNLQADYRPLINYAEEHLKGLVRDPFRSPDLLTRCFWLQGDFDPQSNPFSTNGTLNIIGKRMQGNDHELVWLNTLKMKGLQLRFALDDHPMLFEVAYCFQPKRGYEKAYEYEFKRFFSLMSYLVYYPITWYFETRRHWTILHASALATSEGGILIGGLGGVGKTTTCVALMQRQGIKLISENLIFTDGNYIYPCYEPIRLDERSLSMLGEANGITPMSFPKGLKKKELFHLNTNEVPCKVEPTAFFLPQFSSKRYLKPLKPEVAVEKISAMNRLTRELDDYYWYMSAIEMNWPTSGLTQKRIEVVKNLVDKVPCFELGIDTSVGVDAVVEDILSSTEKVA